MDRTVVITLEGEDNSDRCTMSIRYPTITHTSDINLERNGAVQAARLIVKLLEGGKNETF